MQDTLIVVDMQKDFITGSLGSKDAEAIVENVRGKVKSYYDAGKKIIFTKDTHKNDYLSTFEGTRLPVEHCIFGTDGWHITEDILKGIDCDASNVMVVKKMGFGYKYYAEIFDGGSVEVCGLCTDICVVSNALLIRSMFPSSEIIVDAKCCAGTTKDKHNAALDVMESCLIDVINR